MNVAQNGAGDIRLKVVFFEKKHRALRLAVKSGKICAELVFLDVSIYSGMVRLSTA
jgi:hypothetical protein